jgi:2,5-diketo-D-gluconate reductase A
VTPAVNQIELHPHFPQDEQHRVDRDLGICTQSWSPLGRGQELLRASEVAQPAKRLGVTTAQVVLRWHHQLGLLPIPKSSNPQRQRDNLEISGFELSADEVTAITALGRRGGRLWNGDPNTITL